MSSVKNISAILEAFENENTYAFYVPSLKREIKFKPFNIGQQKKLLKATIDNPVFQTRFIVAVYDILAENSTEDLKKLNLTIIDYNSILLQYRKSAYGDSITVTDEGVEYKANINEAIEKINSVPPLVEQDIVEGNIVLTLKTPTFQEQYKLEKELRDGKLNDEQIINGTTNVSSTIGDAFIGEISKYIKDITLLKGEERISVGYNNLSFADRFKVIEQLPSSLIKKALPIIGELTAKLSNSLRVTGTAKDNTSKTVTIAVDSSLFPVE